MKYIKESFFTKYNLEPNIELPKLRVLFQTDPNKRKDLPVVIKTISSKKSLLEEELFTIHNSEENVFIAHGLILESVKKILEKSSVEYFTVCCNNLKQFILEKENWNKFFYISNIEEDKENIIEFLNIIEEELVHFFINSINDKDINSLTNMYNSLKIIDDKEYSKDLIKLINDEFIDFTDNILKLDDFNEESKKRFIKIVEISGVLKNSEIQESLYYVIDNMMNDMDKYVEVILPVFCDLKNVFNNKQFANISKNVIKLFNTTISFRGDFVERPFTCYKQLLDCYKLILKQMKNETFAKETELCKEEIKLGIDLIEFVINNGESWLKNYFKYYNEFMKNKNEKTIFKIVKHVFCRHPKKTIYHLFANYIIDNTDFIQYLTWIISGHISFVKGESDKYIGAKDIDKFIAQYYWLIFIDKTFGETFNENTVNTIRSYALDILKVVQPSFDIINKANEIRNDGYYLSYEDENLVRRAFENVGDAFNKIPLDFRLGDDTIYDILVRSHSDITGDVSLSSLYIDAYNMLFVNGYTIYGRASFIDDYEYYCSENNIKEYLAGESKNYNNYDDIFYDSVDELKPKTKPAPSKPKTTSTTSKPKSTNSSTTTKPKTTTSSSSTKSSTTSSSNSSYSSSTSSTRTSSSSSYSTSSNSNSSSTSTSSNNNSNSSQGCYIATCVYGSYDCPEVWRLRRYRDYYLGEHWWGRMFIKCYYAISPKLVKYFGDKEWFRSIAKKIVDRKIEDARNKGFDDKPYEDKNW